MISSIFKTTPIKNGIWLFIYYHFPEGNGESSKRGKEQLSNLVHNN